MCSFYISRLHSQYFSCFLLYLSYCLLSERVIAMSFPSSGIMALYRNPIHVSIVVFFCKICIDFVSLSYFGCSQENSLEVFRCTKSLTENTRSWIEDIKGSVEDIKGSVEDNQIINERCWMEINVMDAYFWKGVLATKACVGMWALAIITP